jgi:hypothetical protein
LSDVTREQPTLEWIPVEQFIVDDRYQRKVSSKRSQDHILEIATDFHWEFFGSVTASREPDNKHKLIDGHHRVEAAKLAGKPKVPTVLLRQLTVEAQAEACVKHNEKRINFDAFAMHHTKLTRGDAEAHALQNLADTFHLTVPSAKPGKTSKPGTVSCLGWMTKMMRQYDPPIVYDAVGAVSDAYYHQKFGINRVCLDAAAQMIAEGIASRADLAKALAQSTVSELLTATSSQRSPKNQVAAIINILQQRLRETVWLVDYTALPADGSRLVDNTKIDNNTQTVNRNPKWGYRNPGTVPPKVPEPPADKRALELAAQEEFIRTRGVTRELPPDTTVVEKPKGGSGFSMFDRKVDRKYIDAVAEGKRAQGRAFKPD